MLQRGMFPMLDSFVSLKVLGIGYTPGDHEELANATAVELLLNWFLNQARAWFPEIVLRKVCVCACMYVYLFVFPYPREQTFYLKLESSLYTNNKG